MAGKTPSMGVFDQIKTGLEDCLAHAKEELTLVAEVDGSARGSQGVMHISGAATW